RPRGRPRARKRRSRSPRPTSGHRSGRTRSAPRGHGRGAHAFSSRRKQAGVRLGRAGCGGLARGARSRPLRVRGGLFVSLETEIEDLRRRADEGLTASEIDPDDRDTLDDFLDALETGTVRAAEKTDGEWVANEWVKHGLLLNFSLRETHKREYGDVAYHDVLSLRSTADLGERGTRNTPDGTVIRRDAFVGSDAILMSPSFVNAGASV